MKDAFATLPYAMPFLAAGIIIMLRVWRWLDSRNRRTRNK